MRDCVSCRDCRPSTWPLRTPPWCHPARLKSGDHARSRAAHSGGEVDPSPLNAGNFRAAIDRGCQSPVQGCTGLPREFCLTAHPDGAQCGNAGKRRGESTSRDERAVAAEPTGYFLRALWQAPCERVVASAALVTTLPIQAASRFWYAETSELPCCSTRKGPSCSRALPASPGCTMTKARGADGELLPDALRLTPLGRLLRASSLDELPGSTTSFAVG